MAAMASTIENQTESPKGPSKVMMIVAYAVITLLAGGAGFGVSATMLKPSAMSTATPEGPAAAEPAPAAAKVSSKAHGSEAAESHGEPEKLAIVDLPSITTNLVDPADAWIRLELSLVFEGESDSQMAQDVQQDILAYVHTMKLYNIRGGSGYQHLIEDLEERAAIRTEGRVRRVLVRSLILE